MGQPVSWVRIPPSPNFKNPLYSGFLFYAKIFVGLFLNYKETGQYRKGELASKPQNIKEFKSILGLQKSPVCPICVTIVSGISLNL